MIGFGNISGLFALAGLLVPLVIHLLSNKTTKTVDFGSLRFIESSETRTIKSIKINDLLSLILRSLILMLLSFLLAEMFVKQSKSERNLVLIDPHYIQNPAVVAIMDTLPSTSEAKWLAAGYPDIADSNNIQPMHWSKLENETFGAKFVSLVSPLKMGNMANKFNGHLPVENLIVLPENEVNTLKKAKESFDQTFTISQKSTGQFTSYSQPESNLRVTYSIAAGSEFQELELIVYSALLSLQKFGYIEFTRVDINNSPDLIFWLSVEEPPRYKNIILARSTLTSSIERHPNGVLYIDPQLTKKEAVRNGFAEAFALAISDLFENSRYALSSYPSEELILRNQPDSDKVLSEFSREPLTLWLWLAAIILFLFERTINSYRV